VFVNNVRLNEQEVGKQEVPVLFEKREVAPSVWLPVLGLGARLRKGKDTVRIEFEPTNTKVPYSAQFSWASVMDEHTENREGDRVQSTNQSGEGADTKQATGKVAFEQEFVAEFASDLPWHHYPPVATLSEEDKQHLAGLVKKRAEAFKPNCAEVYKWVEGKEGLELAEVKKLKSLEKAYAAGVRIAAPAPEQIEFVTTGGPEVVVQRKDEENLYRPTDPQAFERIKGDEVQMAASAALFMAYPPRLAVVRTPAGVWEVVY